jgi:uncharacterized membrane protein
VKITEIKEKSKAMLPYLEPKSWKVALGFYVVMTIILIFNAKICGINADGISIVFVWVLTLMIYTINLAVNTAFLWWAIGAARGVSAPTNEIKNAVNNVGSIFLARLAAVAISAVASLFLIVPGLYFMYSYAMVPYIMHDEPDLGIIELLQKSRKMMKGNKIRFFVFQLSFIGEILITILTLGIAGLHTAPYMYIASAMFYDTIKKD